MDDHDFKSVRKAFNIVSVLILILAYSNAEINEINFLGIDITLEGKKVYVGIFVLYLYFVWRFFTKLPWKGGFQNDFYKYIIGLQQNSVKHNSKKKIESLSSNAFNGFNVTRIHKKSIRHLELRWAFTDRSSGEDVFEPYTERVTLPVIYVMLKFIWFSFKYDKFGDYMFPLIPFLANLLFFFLDKNWQGSIYNLFT